MRTRLTEARHALKSARRTATCRFREGGRSIVSPDLELGEDDNEEPGEFPPPERKLVTQSYDLSMQVLLDQWQTETLIVPEIQRDYVWDLGKASRLIESLLLNIPIPVLYLAETHDSK